MGLRGSPFCKGKTRVQESEAVPGTQTVVEDVLPIWPFDVGDLVVRSFRKDCLKHGGIDPNIIRAQHGLLGVMAAVDCGKRICFRSETEESAESSEGEWHTVSEDSTDDEGSE